MDECTKTLAFHIHNKNCGTNKLLTFCIIPMHMQIKNHNAAMNADNTNDIQIRYFIHMLHYAAVDITDICLF